MKKVLLVATVQSHIMNFHLPYISYFIDRGFEVHVCCKMDKDKYKYNEENIVWTDVNFSRLPISPSNIKSLLLMIKYMRLHNFSLIHVNTPVAALIARIAAFIVRAQPIIYTAHGFHFFKGAPLLNWLIYYPVEIVGARLSDAIITINDEDYNRAKQFKLKKNGRGYKVNGVGITLNDKEIDLYTDLEKKRIRESVGIENQDFVLTVIAELVKNKNHIQIIDAVEKLGKQLSLKVLFIGDGKLELWLKEEVNKRNLNDSILFLGFRKDVESLVSISDAIGLFSYREGLPKSIMEAMIQSKPIIATNVRGNRDLVKHDINGLLVDIGDVNMASQSLESLIYDKELCERMGRKSFEMIQEYKLEIIMQEMDKIYSDLLTRIRY